MVGKQIQEDRGRQLAMMNLAHEFNDASTGKEELRKAYEECRDIPLEQRALIGKFLKIEFELDYEMNNDLLLKATILDVWRVLEKKLESMKFLEKNLIGRVEGVGEEIGVDEVPGEKLGVDEPPGELISRQTRSSFHKKNSHPQ
nr:hypothetical protein [Tanacetum cinerariifolium]